MLNEVLRKSDPSFFVEYLNTFSKKPHLFLKDDIQFFSLKIENSLNESKNYLIILFNIYYLRCL